MKLQEIFPITININKKDIETANIYDVNKCTGAKTLKKALKKKKVNLKDCFFNWGKISGYIEYNPTNEKSFIRTKEEINFMMIKEPQEVTFILSKTYLS